MLALNLVVLIFLAIASIIDIKFQKIPSIFLTGAIFVIFMINFSNLLFGISSLLFAIILYEGDFIGGLADIKVISLIGLMINSYIWLFTFFILVVVLGVCWKMIIKYNFKKKKEWAFLPLLLLIYIILLLSGGII